MTDPNDGDRPEIISAPDPSRPTSEGDDPNLGFPALQSFPKAPTVRRWVIWGTAAALIAAGTVTAFVTTNRSSARNHPPLSGPLPPVSEPRPPSLPLSAVHDAHGLIVTLPDVRRILGPTPLPGVTLSNNQVTTGRLSKDLTVTDEMTGGFANSASRYRSFDVTLTKFPSIKSIRSTYGIIGPGPFRRNVHRFTGPSTPITGLRGPGIVFKDSDGPYDAAIPNKQIEFDYVGPSVQMRYRNIAIRISFKSADFRNSKDGKVQVIYPPYNKSRDEVIAIARKIAAHL